MGAPLPSLMMVALQVTQSSISNVTLVHGGWVSSPPDDRRRFVVQVNDRDHHHRSSPRPNYRGSHNDLRVHIRFCVLQDGSES